MGVMRLWRRLAQPKAGIFITALAMAVLSLVAGVALLAVSAWLIVRANQRPAILTLTVAIVSVRFFGLARPVFRYVERVLSHEAVLRTLGSIRAAMVDSLSTAAPTHPLFARRGEVLSRLVGDVEKSQDYFLRLVSPIVSAVLVVGLASLLEFIIDPEAGIRMAMGLTMTLFISVVLASASARAASTAVERGQLSGAINELVRGAEELHMWQAAQRELQRVKRLDAAVTARARRSVLGLGSGSFAVMLGLGATLASITPGAIAGYRAGEMTWPTMAVLVLLPLALLDVLLPVPQAMAIAAEVRTSLDRIDAVVEQPRQPTGLVPANSDLHVSGVSATWNEKAEHLHSVDLHIPMGSKVAIVGSSGAGKTTLALVLAGLIVPSRGDVLLGGIEVSAIDDDERARWIAYAAQDAYLFNTSVRENLLIADPHATDTALQHALNAVGLRPWIDTVGLDYIVGENGNRMSGGQRRRLSIARALIAGAPVTIVDEPTAHLDLKGGDDLLHALLAGVGTRIIITHRIAPLCDELVDQVIVMEHGRVAEVGTHSELMALNGRYVALRYAEAMGELPRIADKAAL
jgi:thiol reductant ABC exporter CydC subunit